MGDDRNFKVDLLVAQLVLGVDNDKSYPSSSGIKKHANLSIYIYIIYDIDDVWRVPTRLRVLGVRRGDKSGNG